MKILPAYDLKSFSAIICYSQTHFLGVLNGWVMTARLLKMFLLIHSQGCLCFHVFVSQKTDIIKLLNIDGRLLFVLLKSLHFSCQTHIEPMARVLACAVCVCSRPGSQLYLSYLSIYVHRTAAALSVSLFLTFIFYVFSFVPLFFSSLSFISHFKIHYFFILFTILDPFDTPSEQPTIIQNVVSSELRWKEGRCTHTYTCSAALDTWLCDMAGLPWDSFKAQWHKFMIAAPHFLPKLSCCCSAEGRGEERGKDVL